MVTGRDLIGGRGKINRWRQKQVVAGELRMEAESISSGDTGRSNEQEAGETSPGPVAAERRQHSNATEGTMWTKKNRAITGDGKSIQDMENMGDCRNKTATKTNRTSEPEAKQIS
jgi:hypothetical protein